MRAFGKRTFVSLGLLFIGIQLIHPASQTTPAGLSKRMAEVIDPRVGEIFDRSCQDCHSAGTHWPWYGRIAPLSWIVVRDVQRGRGKLDFSQWANLPHSSNERMEICDAVSDGSMPMKAYALIHRNARLSSEDVNRVCAWADSADTRVAASN
jgi:heme-binding protein